MASAVEIRGLTKVFGDKKALDEVDLVVEEGSIFGFLGPNGAGKTTTIRIMTGLSRPSGGSVAILGKDATAAGNEVRAHVGFLPDVPGFYDWMTAEEFLRFSGELFGIEASVLRDRVGVLLGMAGLLGVKTRIGGYSRGMKQRLGVAQALVNAPRLLILDEPTSALDPMGRKEVLEMLVSLRGRTTVFFSTHILADVERVCDTVAILNEGRVVAQGPIGEITSHRGGHKIVLEVTDGAELLADKMARQAWAASVVRAGGGCIEVTTNDREAAQRAIPAFVAEASAGLVRMEAGEVDLEEAFVELVGGGRR